MGTNLRSRISVEPQLTVLRDSGMRGAVIHRDIATASDFEDYLDTWLGSACSLPTPVPRLPRLASAEALEAPELEQMRLVVAAQKARLDRKRAQMNQQQLAAARRQRRTNEVCDLCGQGYRRAEQDRRRRACYVCRPDGCRRVPTVSGGLTGLGRRSSHTHRHIVGRPRTTSKGRVVTISDLVRPLSPAERPRSPGFA